MQMRPVTELTDPAVPVLLDIYQKSFPLQEQMLISFFWRILQNPADSFRLFVGEEDSLNNPAEPSTLGFVLWEVGKESGDPVYLWYLAVASDARGKGLGEALYRFVIETAFAQGTSAVAFEIEDEEEVAARMGASEAQIAAKRCTWYQRLGAKKLDGVEYWCGTDWQKPIRMAPMIHTVTDCTPAQALVLVKEAFGSDGDRLTVVGSLELN